MTDSNQDIIRRFFEAYSKKDMAALAEVTTDDLAWHFPGHNPMSGVKHGREEVVAFFDRMGGLGFRPEKLIIGENESYVVETQWVRGHVDGEEVTWAGPCCGASATASWPPAGTSPPTSTWRTTTSSAA